MELSAAARCAVPAMALACAVAGPVGAGPPDPEAVTFARRAAELLVELASLPSQTADREGTGRAAAWLREQFGSLGFDTRILEGEGNPLVFARHPGAPGSPSVLFYLHYDTQPPGPAADWGSTGGDPFSPRLMSDRWDAAEARGLRIQDLDAESIRSARLYARGAADDKAPIAMHLTALEGWLSRDSSRRLDLRFLLDGEEEGGSPHIAEGLARHGGILRADLLVLCDGPMDALGRPSLYLGARGDMHVRVRLSTAAASGHSGNYGLLPNAAWRLASLLATMKDPNGRVTVDGFADGADAPTAEERAALAEASLAEPVIARGFGVERFEGDPDKPYYERLLFSPGLNINQLSAGRPGNQIPHVAEALLDVRLVTRQDPTRVFEAIRNHLTAREPAVEVTLLDAVSAGRMDPHDPDVERAIAAAGRAAGRPVLVYPGLGGTLPLLEAFTAAGHRYVGLPLVNFDNNQHVANENVALSAMADGVSFLAGFYAALAGP